MNDEDRMAIVGAAQEIHAIILHKLTPTDISNDKLRRLADQAADAFRIEATKAYAESRP
jgi:hypothetical protein